MVKIPSLILMLIVVTIGISGCSGPSGLEKEDANRIQGKISEIQNKIQEKTQTGEDLSEIVTLMENAGTFMDSGKPLEAEKIMDIVLKKLDGEDVDLPNELLPSEEVVEDVTDCKYENSIVFESDIIITDNCVVEGDLTIRNAAVVEINYDSDKKSSFVVHGDVNVEDHAKLQIHGTKEDSFIIVNEENSQRTMSSKNNAVIELIGIEFKTQLDSTDKGSIYMNYNAFDNSTLIINDAMLNGERGWLLGNFKERSSLEAVNTNHIPTEIYIHDQVTIKISGDKTHTGVWFGDEHLKGEITLPDVTDNFDWEIGKDAGLDVGWHLKVENANVGLGLNSYPGSNVVVNGKGNFAELTIGYYVSEGIETLEDLSVGLHNGQVSDRLTLNNVDLGPIAWQIYVGNNEMLTIKNSIVNEIGIFSTGHVTVENSTLQLAVLGAMGQSSSIDITNSEIWNQEIVAGSESKITITNSDLYGSLLRTLSSTSQIVISGGNFYENPRSCSPNKMVDRETGQPQCNPFRSSGYPEATGQGTVTCQDTNNCNI